ncbi:MAG: CarD family transcriptional regulator, partial [Bdellovibrionota bacterium]
MSHSDGKKRASTQLNGLSPAALAYLLPEILPHEGNDLRAVLLVADEAEADRLTDDLEFFGQFRGGAWKNLSLLRLGGWEQSPYRNLQPGLSARLDRIKASHFLASPGSNQPWVLVSSARSFLQASATREFLGESVLVGKGIKIHPEALASQLSKIGYTKTENVEDPGNFSVRGGIVDVFPPTLDNPVRLEFFDEEIESVRIFNPETQRSVRLLGEKENVQLIPVREFACDPESLASAREVIKDWCDSHDLPRSSRERLSLLLSQGVATPEMDYLLPFFRQNQTWPVQLLPKGCTLVLSEPESLRESVQAWREREDELYKSSLDRQQVIPGPDMLFMPLTDALSSDRWAGFAETRMLALGESSPRFERLRLGSKKKATDMPGLLRTLGAMRDRGTTTVIVANSQSQLDRVLFLLSENKVRAVATKNESDLPKDPSIVGLALGQLSESFHLPEKKIAFLSEDEIFGEKAHIQHPGRKRTAAPTISMDDLVAGDLVVHLEHGIGRYIGLSRVKALGNEGDFVQIEYAEGSKLYVPVYRLEGLSRYVGTSGENAALDRLGSGSFAKTKEKVKAAIKDIAQDLLRVQAERELREGYAFSAPDDEYRRFEAEFPFDETPDQAKAIQDTLQDMVEGKPMDRLVCGDVGFGKTEVAIRAAFKAIQDGKQVAVLVELKARFDEENNLEWARALDEKGVHVTYGVEELPVK